MKRLLTFAFAALALAGCANTKESTAQATVQAAERPQPPAISVIPPTYATPASHRGTVETFTYRTNGTEKTAFAYLPYGYEASGERYNILYFMHGGGGTAGQFWEESYGGGYVLNNILDHAIADGVIDPLIVVTPTFYAPDDHDTGVSNAGEQVKKFPAEFEKDLMRAAESRYRTYAKTTDAAGLRASRSHRAFGGFSMGSVTTWYEFAAATDFVAYFMPLSGDSWQFGNQGGKSKPKETASYLAGIAKKAQASGNRFYIYAATGSEDIAFDALDAQINAMRNESAFTFSPSPKDGNITFQVYDGGRHVYQSYRNYIISGLRTFFEES